MHVATAPAPQSAATQRTARLTGAAYLGIIASGIFAEFFVRMSLVVPDDPVATATNIAGSSGLFGAGIGADALMIAFDVVVAFGLYRLLKPVHRPLAMAATGFRLVQAAILAVNLINPVHALSHAQRAVATGAAGPAGQALHAMEAHAFVYDVALIAFGLACLALGRLLGISRAVPTILAVGITVTGVVYLIGSFATVASVDAASMIDPLYGVAFGAELAFAIWLTVKGLPTTARAASTPSLAPAI